mgnify:CR=1 FL=1
MTLIHATYCVEQAGSKNIHDRYFLEELILYKKSNILTNVWCISSVTEKELFVLSQLLLLYRVFVLPNSSEIGIQVNHDC